MSTSGTGPAAASGTDHIDALLAGGGTRTWNATLGDPVTVSYGFLTSLPAEYAGTAEDDAFAALSSAQRTFARQALTLWSDLCGITFVEDSATPAAADIRFGTAALSVSATSFYPDTGTGGDVWLSNTDDANTDPYVGSTGFATLLHQIGHALGLKHPQNYDGDGVGDETPYLTVSEDTRRYTVMSENAHPSVTAADAVTPMLYDVAAIQYLYGANTTVRSGDTGYNWAQGAASIETLWDGGGFDAIDASNQSADQIIDLRPGHFSSIAGYADNVVIAYGTTIEEALGGSGKDTLISGSGDNVLIGKAGHDTFRFYDTWGSDLVVDDGDNTIVLDVTSESMLLRREGRDLRLIKSGTSDQIVIENAYLDASGSAMEEWVVITSNGSLDLSTATGNRAPVVTATDGSTTAGASVAISDYFTVVDPEGDDATHYEFWDGGVGENGAYIAVSGIARDADASIVVTAAELSSVTVVGGVADGTETLWVRAYDGEDWSDWARWDLTTTGGNAAPVVIGADRTMAAGLSLSAGALFSASDADGIAAYEFWDSTGASNSGHFVVDGVEQAANQTIAVSKERLESTRFLASDTIGVVDQLWVRAHDGTSWGDWTTWTVEATANAAPVATATTPSWSVLSRQGVDATSLFSVADPDGNDVTAYEFWDSGGGVDDGYLVVDGVAQGANQAIPVSSGQMATTRFVGGGVDGSETLWVRAYDGGLWGEWVGWTMTTWGGNAVPFVIADTGRGFADTAYPVATLFSVGDDNGDAMATYEFWDSTDASGSGYFLVNGVAQPANQTITVSADRIGSASFVAGNGDGVDQVWARVSDGKHWSEWLHWTMVTAAGGAPGVTLPAAGQSVGTDAAVPAGSLFSIGDPDGQGITDYEFWDSGGTSGSGYFMVDGVAQPANQTIRVAGNALDTVFYVGGGGAGSETVWVRGSDGGRWSEWTSWTMVTGG